MGYGRYLSTESDMNVLVRGVRVLLKLAHTDPVASKIDLKPHGISTSSPWWPGVADSNKVCLDPPFVPLAGTRSLTYTGCSL